MNMENIHTHTYTHIHKYIYIYIYYQTKYITQIHDIFIHIQRHDISIQIKTKQKQYTKYKTKYNMKTYMIQN